MTSPHTRRAARRSIVAVVLAASLARALAQDAVMPVPSEPVAAPIVREQAPPTPGSMISWPGETLLRFGPVSLHPHLRYRYLNSSGLPAGGLRVASTIQTVSVGVLADIGKNWSLDYTPTWTYYSARELRDRLNQTADLNGAGVLGDWGLHFTENYSKSTLILTETGRQTGRETRLTSLGAGRSLGSDFSLDLGASLAERYANGTPGTRDWSTTNWLVKKVTPQLDLSVGPAFGYVDISGQPSMDYQRYLGRARWQPTSKLSLSIAGGVERRRVRSADGRTLRNPRLDATLAWQPFETTSFTFNAARVTTVAYFRDQVNERASWEVSWNQRLLGHFYLGTSYSRRKTSYESALTTLTVDREDRINTTSVQLSVLLLKRFTVAAIYNRKNNSSSSGGFAYSSRQYGLEVGARF